jgi:hypothetical protein
MGAYRIDRRGSVEEEYFLDPAEAKARRTVLERDSTATDVTSSVDQNHHWMVENSIWYCVRWTHVNGVTE